MAEEIPFENVRIFNFEGLVTLTLTSDRVILHTVVHHSSTSTYKPNLFQSNRRHFLWTDGRIHGRTFETGFIRSTLSKSRPKYCSDNLAAVSVLTQQLLRVRSRRRPSERSLLHIGSLSHQFVPRHVHR